MVGADQVILVAHALTEDLPEPRARDVATVSAPVGLLTDGTQVVAYGLDSVTQHMRVPLLPAPVAGTGCGGPSDTPTSPPSTQHPPSTQQESAGRQATRPPVDVHVADE